MTLCEVARIIKETIKSAVPIKSIISSGRDIYTYFLIYWQEVFIAITLGSFAVDFRTRPSMATKAIVILYSRPGCHLCDEARQAIDAAKCSADYDFETVNIESDPELLNKYKYEIPVVLINGVEAFKHQVDSKRFAAAIHQLPKG